MIIDVGGQIGWVSTVMPSLTAATHPRGLFDDGHHLQKLYAQLTDWLLLSLLSIELPPSSQQGLYSGTPVYNDQSLTRSTCILARKRLLTIVGPFPEQLTS